MRARIGYWAVGVGLLAVGPAVAQNPAVELTRPVMPTTEELNRLNLKLGWRLDLPVEGRKDGIATVQQDGGQVFVQLRSGLVVAIDARDGSVQWRARFGAPYALQFPVGLTPRYALVLNGTRLYGFDRTTGSAAFVHDLEIAPSAGATADARQVYVNLGSNRLMALILPDAAPPPDRVTPPPGRTGPESVPNTTPVQTVPRPQAPARSLDVDFRADVTRSGQTPSLAVLPTLRPPYRLDNGADTPSLAVVPSLHPTYVRTPDGKYEPRYRLGNGADTPSLAVVPSMSFVGDLRFAGLKAKPLRTAWEFHANLRLEAAPLVTPEYLFLATTDRTAFALGKEDRKLIYDFQADTPISAAPGQYGEVAYVPSQDSTVYAVNIILGRVLWRFNAGGRLDRRPVVTDEEVFTYGERSKIARLNRDTGELFWQAAIATDVRAVSPKFVYASDRTDRLFILDRRTGSRVAEYDTRGFNVPIVNTQDDRLYLGTHSGTLLCLFDRDIPNPVPLRPGEPKAAPPVAKKGGEAPKAGEVPPKK